jgi:hypothetical protein
MAAVAVLALVTTALAGAAMQGLASSGDADRRLRASLLADAALGEVEAQLAAGSAPALGLVESEQGDFALEIEVRPFDLSALAALAREAAPAPSRERTERARRAAEAERGERAEGEPAFELLVAEPGAPPPLLEVDVRVRWIEGAFEQSVTRTTFAADPAQVRAALEAAGVAGAEAEDAGEETGEAAGGGGAEGAGVEEGGGPEEPE